MRCLAGLALAAPALGAQTTVGGRVVDERGAPVVGADVRDAAGHRRVSTATGGFGGLTVGPITVRRLGYAPLDTVLAAGEAHRLALRPSASVLARLVINPGFSGTGPTVQAPTVTMTRRDLEMRPQPGEDLFRALARLPGVAASELSARLRVRGGAADELLYLFDGAELPDPFHLPDVDAALSMVDLAMVGGVDLHAGTLPLELGQRSAGAMVFPLPAFDGRASTTSASVSLTGVRVGQHLRLGPRSDADLLVRRGYLELVLNALGESKGLTPRYGDSYARIRWFGSRDRVAAHVLDGTDFLRYARSDDAQSTGRYRTSVGWITTEHERGAWRATTTVSLTHRLNDRDVRDVPGTLTQSGFRDRRDTWTGGVRADVRRALGTRHLMQAGGSWQPAQTHADLFRLRDTLAVVRNVVQRGIDTTRLLETVATQRSGAWLGLRSALPWRVTQELGARVDAASWTGEALVAPRAAWLVPMRGATTLRVGVGVTTQTPLLEERALADGDTTRYPAVRALQQAIGVSGAGDAIRWRADVYWRRTSHERPQYVNARNGAIIAPELFDDRVRLDATRGDASGIELSLRDAGRGPWTWAAGWTIARSRLDVQGRWVARPWDRRHTATLDVGRALGAWQFSGGWVYHSGDPTSSSVALQTPTRTGVLTRTIYPRPFDRRMPEYHRLDLRAVRAFERGHTSGRVFLDVLNAYDRRNVRRMVTSIARTASGQELTTTRRETGLPFLPSIGLALDWR
ncbi:MAG: TonB-dependent receptor [Gemmatimonadaceae bacterium]|nr:TonB-dependent receptor [Gemmatimonadaceae bacterium]